MTRMRRPWTRLAGAAMAGHVFFELGAGVGMPFASVLGPAPAAALWTTATAWLQRAAGDPSRDTALAAVTFRLSCVAVETRLAAPRKPIEPSAKLPPPFLLVKVING